MKVIYHGILLTHCILLLEFMSCTHEEKAAKKHIKKHLSKKTLSSKSFFKRNEEQRDPERNLTRVNDYIHKKFFKGRTFKTTNKPGSKRAFLSFFGDRHSDHRYNNLPTVAYDTEQNDPHINHIDLAHDGVATAPIPQELQIGTQPQPAHFPSEEGVTALPEYRSTHKEEEHVNRHDGHHIALPCSILQGISCGQYSQGSHGGVVVQEQGGVEHHHEHEIGHGHVHVINQRPIEITHPPINIERPHYEESHQTVHEQGKWDATVI